MGTSVSGVTFLRVPVGCDLRRVAGVLGGAVDEDAGAGADWGGKVGNECNAGVRGVLKKDGSMDDSGVMVKSESKACG